MADKKDLDTPNMVLRFAKIKYYRTYGKGVINIYVSTDNIHNVYETLNTLKHSPH